MHFILQARLGSTRLPGKILLPFYRDHSILDIIIERISNISENIIIATTTNDIDDPIVKYATNKGINHFRGSENDVLNRFINASEKYNVDKIIRICCDNPFITLNELLELKTLAEKEDYDYMSFIIDTKPSITTHFGFFTEFVTLDALKKVSSLTKNKLYHEHVTNYIYTHPNEFKINFIDETHLLKEKPYIRLTIDTPTDFSNASIIYSHLLEKNMPITIENIVKEVDIHHELKEKMKEEINNNLK